jgi:hypothetical protein
MAALLRPGAAWRGLARPLQLQLPRARVHRSARVTVLTARLFGSGAAGALDGFAFPPFLANFPALLRDTAPPVHVGAPAPAGPPAGGALALIAVDYASQPPPADRDMGGDAATGSGGA